MLDVKMANWCDKLAKRLGAKDLEVLFEQSRRKLTALEATSDPSKDWSSEFEGSPKEVIEDGHIPPLQRAIPSDSVQHTVIDDAALKDNSRSTEKPSTEIPRPSNQSDENCGIPTLQREKSSHSVQNILVDDGNVERWSLVQRRLEKLELEMIILREGVFANKKALDNIEHSTKYNDNSPRTVSNPSSYGNGAKAQRTSGYRPVALTRNKMAQARWEKTRAKKVLHSQQHEDSEAMKIKDSDEDQKRDVRTWRKVDSKTKPKLQEQRKAVLRDRVLSAEKR